MDVVYIVRPGELNEELRYSLRSLQNLEHDRVFIVGHTPSWVTGVQSLQTIQAGTKYGNSTRNVLTACCTDDISDPFVLFNDDFHLTAQVETIPTLHRGPVDDLISDYSLRYPRKRDRPNVYLEGMIATRELLGTLGSENPMSYELHVPLLVHKAAMREAIEVATTAGLEVPHKRSLYGNLANLGGTQVSDVKVNTSAVVVMPEPFVSTCDQSFKRGWIGRRLRAMSPTPCGYEVPL